MVVTGYWKCNFLMTPHVRRSVKWLGGRSDICMLLSEFELLTFFKAWKKVSKVADPEIPKLSYFYF